MVYDVDIANAGSDETEVYDGTLSTSFVDIDCSKFVPAGWRLVKLQFANGGNGSKMRVKGSSVSNGLLPGYMYIYEAMANDVGIFQRCLISASATHRESVVGYRL
jgi:hypothetical protein